MNRGVSDKRILQLIQQQRVPAIMVGGRYLIPEQAVIEFKPHGRTRTRPCLWHCYRAGATVHTWTIEVCSRPGKADDLAQRLTGLYLDQHFLFPGTMQRYMLTAHDDPERLIIVLIWKDTDLTDEASLEDELAAFRAAFADVLDWQSSTMTRAQALAYT